MTIRRRVYQRQEGEVRSWIIEVPTFRDILDAVQNLSWDEGRVVEDTSRFSDKELRSMDGGTWGEMIQSEEKQTPPPSDEGRGDEVK